MKRILNTCLLCLLTLLSIADPPGKSKAFNEVSYVFSDPREAYEGLVKVNDTLHVSQLEVVNSRYDKFLLDLLKQRRFDDLEIAKNEKTDWRSLLQPMDRDLTMDQIFQYGKPDSDGFPVCNVSYEAAVLYCGWLTNIYNKLEHKKKKYKKVKFRLPTEKEWEYIARSGDDRNDNYPWIWRSEKSMKKYGLLNSITNSKGCYLANIQTSRTHGKQHKDEGHTCPNKGDGGIFPVPGSSYAANAFGLCCIIGNVAEMVQEKGIAKGGGWNTQVEDAIIPARQTYEGPSPNIGFRVVMVVLEE